MLGAKRYRRAGLLGIGALPAYRGTGLAQRLAIALYSRYEERGLKEAFYYPVNEENARSRNFAESLGGTAAYWRTATTNVPTDRPFGREQSQVLPANGGLSQTEFDSKTGCPPCAPSHWLGHRRSRSGVICGPPVEALGAGRTAPCGGGAHAILSYETLLQ